jgi:N-acetyl-anhydromuramyl-L-alanine amidase AmpD
MPTIRVHFGPRLTPSSYIPLAAQYASGQVVSSGAQGNAQYWKRFFNNDPSLGIHYIVDRQGAVATSTPEDQMANHAHDHDEGTIGIELVHNGDGIEPFNGEQIDALIKVIKSIRTRCNISIANIKGHAQRHMCR